MKSNLFGDLSTAPVLAQIEVGKVFANPNQPRTVFDETKLQELAASIKAEGQIQPIVVRNDGDDRYVIVAGERRWRAAQINKAETIDCIVRNDENSDVVSVIENMQRDDLKPIEEARAVAKLVKDKGIPQGEAGKLVGKKRLVINQLLKLNNLPEIVQEESLELEVSKTILIELSQLKSADTIIQLWNKAKEGNLKVSEIRAVKKPAKSAKQSVSKLTPNAGKTINKGYKLVKELEGVSADELEVSQLAELEEIKVLIDRVISSLTSSKR